ncbi:MAG: HAMP domain-containing sensor histidine kinase [Cyanobacteriota bacterium]|nr:HAMP domain-containing sensor histidine kinase [Cyanobacteriota bacterium]
MKRWLAPRPASISFRRYSLRLELLAAAAGAALLISAGMVSLAVLRGRILELQRADANRVSYHLKVHLDQGRKQLQHYLRLPRSQWQPQAGALLPSFSDLYELDDQQHVRRVIKTASGSRVFEGFSFAGSAISHHLRPNDRQSGGITPIVRGLEDEFTSVYVWQRVDGRLMLGRIQLSTIKDFLKRYSAFSGMPTLLVSRDGFVQLSGVESPHVASIDLGRHTGPSPLERRARAMPPLQLGGRLWLPVASEESFLGAEIVTLLPTGQMASIRQVLLSAGALVLLLWGLILLWKNWRLDREMFDPMAAFTEGILEQEKRLRQGSLLETAAADDRTRSDTRFRELAALRMSFGRLMEAIIQRDQALRQAHELQQRNEERQRLVLQSKLKSSLMAASVAHEINLPLATIRMLCNQADQRLGHNTLAINEAELVSSLSQQCRQVSNVIERMRMLLRNVQTEHTPIQPVAVLQGACRSVKPLLRELQVELEVCGLQPPPVAILRGDAVQLQMAVSNLLRNGIDAVAEQPLGHRRLRLNLCVEDGELVVEVSDSGQGIPFEPSDATVLQSNKPGGSGLGLFVARTALEHHHGRLSFGRCPLLGGARVRIHLPLPSGCAPTPRPQRQVPQ